MIGECKNGDQSCARPPNFLIVAFRLTDNRRNVENRRLRIKSQMQYYTENE